MNKLTNSAHKTEGANRTKTVRFFPFVFTGKEHEEETGYGYFGARYMDHELMTMWLSVDPMADKYPSISPYAYCAWNPVNLVDPDGRKIKGVTYNSQTGIYTYTEGAKRVGVDRYINARCQTARGREAIQRMINSPKKFKIRVTDKPIVLPDGNGKVCQLSGIVLKGNFILVSTADKVTSECDAIYVNGSIIVNEYYNVRDNDLASPPVESEFEDAYKLTEMEEFEKQHPYLSEEQRIHGIGAHEETHALDNGSEVDALNNEKNERLEYIKEVQQ